MDEGTFNCSSLLACLNVFHVLWDTEKGKEEQQRGITISSCFLPIPLTKQDSVAIIPYYITWKQRMLSNFGLKCLFTYFVFQAPKYCEFLWSKDRAQHWLWFTEDPVTYHTWYLPAQGLLYHHSKKHLQESGEKIQ